MDGCAHDGTGHHGFRFAEAEVSEGATVGCIKLGEREGERKCMSVRTYIAPVTHGPFK